MDAAQRQFLQLKSELEHQKNELQKALEETRKNTREAQEDIAWLQAHRQAREVEETPQPSDAPATQSGSITQGGKFFGNGDRSPTTEELMRVWDTAQEVELFEELQNWIDRDRAAQEASNQAQIQPNDKKWFKNGIPSVEEMLNPQNFNEMLRELEQI